MVATPVELYLAPPHIMSRPLSMQPSMVAEAIGTGISPDAHVLADGVERQVPVHEVLELRS